MTINEKLIEEARNEYKNPAPGSVGDLIRRLADALEAAMKSRPGGLDEVLVEGSWFIRADLPEILGNFMRLSDEHARHAKELSVSLTEVRAALTVFEKAHTPNVRDPEKTHIPTEGVSLSAHTPTDDEAVEWRPEIPGRIWLKHPDGTPKTMDEIRAEAAAMNAAHEQGEPSRGA